MATAPFVFFDLRTADASAVRRFYTELFGWKIVDVPSGAGTAPMFVTDDGPLRHILQLVPLIAPAVVDLDGLLVGLGIR